MKQQGEGSTFQEKGQSYLGWMKVLTIAGAVRRLGSHCQEQESEVFPPHWEVLGLGNGGTSASPDDVSDHTIVIIWVMKIFFVQYN